MPRPNLDLGTAGAVRVYPVASGGFRAMTRYRDWNGTTRSIERRGATKGAATRALALAIRDRSQASGSADITPDTKVDVLAETWFAEISGGSLSPSTLQLYGDRLSNQVRPALGDLKIRELTVGTIDRHLKVVKASNGPAIAKATRTVLSGLCNLACRHDALPSNPCRDIGRLSSGPKKPATSLSADEIRDLRRRLAEDEIAREADIVDLVDLLMASGLRLGEAMALRWADIDLDGGTVGVSGTALRIRGKGVVIKHSAKTTAGQRILELPSWAVKMLRHRHDGGLNDLVFPAPRSGNVRDRSNTGRALRNAFARVGYPRLTAHAFRRSVATMMSDAGLSSRAAADQLGHQKVSLTTDVYFGRKKRVTGAAQLLEQLDIDDWMAPLNQESADRRRVQSTGD